MSNIVNVFKRPIVFFINHKDSINHFLSIFLLSYFILIFLPYVVADIPFLNNFFMGSITKLLYRAVTTIYLCVYGLLLGFINKGKIKWHFLIGGFILITCYVLSVILAPKYYYYSLVGLTRRVEYYSFYVGTYSYFTYTFSFIADVISFVIFLSYIPSAMKNIKQLYPTLLFLVIFMLFAAAYSVLKEHSEIISLLKGGSEYSITVKSVFHSKNAYGLYLFVASLSAAFLIMIMKNKWKWLLVIPLLVFPFMCLCSMCKSALLCCLLLDIFVIWYFAFFSKGTLFWISLSLMILTIVAMLGIILIVTIPSLSEGSLSQVYDLLVKLFKGLFTRTERWVMVRYVVYGPFIAIGMNESNATYYLEIMSQVLQDLNVTDFHSAYVTWYAHHGIIGCVVYLSLICYLVYKIILVCKRHKNIGFLLTILLLTCFVFMIPESYVLFISISSYAFIVNVILICPVELLTKSDNNNKENLVNEK